MTDRPSLDGSQRAFLAAARSATLATIAPDGRPRLVPICFVVLGADAAARVYSPLDDKPKASADPLDLARVRDLLARPAATLLVDRWSEDWDRLGWLRLDVRATIVEPGAGGAHDGGTEPGEGGDHASAVAALRAKYPQYERHRLGARPILRFEIERVVAWGDLTPDEARPA